MTTFYLMVQLLDAALMTAETTKQGLARARYDCKCSASANAEGVQHALQFLLVEHTQLESNAERVANDRYKTKMGSGTCNEPNMT